VSPGAFIQSKSHVTILERHFKQKESHASFNKIQLKNKNLIKTNNQYNNDDSNDYQLSLKTKANKLSFISP